MPKKVLHVITGLGDGGAEGVLSRLVLGSTRAQHVVVSLIDDGKYGQILRNQGIRVYTLGMSPNRPNPIKFLRLIRWIRIENPDVVQTWMYHADLMGGLAARIGGCKRVFWGIRHSSLEPGPTKNTTILIARLCAKLSRWLPEKVICCAKKAASVHEGIGYDASKLIVIQNGFDLSRFYPDEPIGKRVRREFGVASDEFLIGMVGRYDPLKNHHGLIDALALLREEGREFQCVLVGRGVSPNNTELARHIDASGLTGQVTLAGSRNDIPAIMNALDLHVLASLGEGFPNVVAEAMACGTPCAVTDVGDARMIVGTDALCCEPGNTRNLAQLISSLIEKKRGDQGAWRELETYSRDQIQRNFTVDQMICRYEACWFGEA